MTDNLFAWPNQLNLCCAENGRYEIIIPERANIAADTVTKQVRAGRGDHVALVFEADDGTVTRLTFAEVEEVSTRLAAALARAGLGRGDRIAIQTGQRPETTIVHMAAYKLGAIVVTVSQLYGPDTVAHILADSGTRILVTEDRIWERFRPERSNYGTLEHVIVVGEIAAGERRYGELVSESAGEFEPVTTSAEDPCLLIYTSGSTGRPKGILHAHRILHAYNVSTTLFYNLEMSQPDLVFWTPADWAWVGGLNDTLFPAWFHGHTMMASQRRFEADWAYQFMARHRVTHAFMTPTALKRLTMVKMPRERYDLALRTVWTGGESLASDTLQWLEEHLRVVCNEGYGLTEVNHMIGNCLRLRPHKPGSMGFEFPGHVVALVDETGEPVPLGEPGEVVTRADNATRFLGYWKRPDLTEEMLLGPWLRTRDIAIQDEDGYFFYRGRTDDLIKSAGYRIGPTEIEDVLSQHSAVADCGVIGVPDPDRGQVVMAFVLLNTGYAPSDQLADELRAHVKDRLAAFKQPRLVKFVSELPITSSGKVSRKELRRRDGEHAAGAA